MNSTYSIHISLYCNYNNIYNNTIILDGGIYISDSYGNIILNNSLTSSDGIRLSESNGNIISYNYISNNINGIRLTSCNNNNISLNTINSSNSDGIYLTSCDNNKISINTIISNNKDGLRLNSNCNDNFIVDNIIRSNNGYGIYLRLSSGNNISGNAISSNVYDGIYLYYYGFYGNNVIYDNIISSNSNNGIYINDCENNLISHNNISSNEKNGIYFYHSGIYMGNNDVCFNTIRSNNKSGIYFYESKNHRLFCNNFIKNIRHVNSSGYSCCNHWRSSSKITYTYNSNTYTNYLGNYWDNYTGIDSDGDGIGDTPYIINGDNDGYPLMEEFENYFGENQPPTVETIDATDVTDTEVTINGLITDDGGSSIIERIFDWGTSPSCSDDWVTDDPSSDHYGYFDVSDNSFSYCLTNLLSNTTYYFRAWAKNSEGWNNGEVLSFTTLTSEERIDGIDVSHHQGSIDWSEVYNSGYRFAFAKATEGDGWTDPNFETNMNEGHDAGMLMGAYHFARPDLNSDALVEAQYFVNVAGNYLKEGWLRPVLDVEGDPVPLPWDELSTWIHEWMNAVVSLTGVQPIIYVNPYYALNLDESLKVYDLWICDISQSPPRTGIWDDWAFWQYSWTGSVPGVIGDVDLDIFNGDVSRLNSFIIDFDSDNDGLPDEEEIKYGTDPDNPDTDGDGLSDWDEVDLAKTYKPILNLSQGELFRPTWVENFLNYSKLIHDGYSSGPPVSSLLLKLFNNEDYYLDLVFENGDDAEDFLDVLIIWNEILFDDLHKNITYVHVSRAQATILVRRFPPKYETIQCVAVQYWFHYIYNQWPDDGLLYGVDDHEGDWEHITIYLDNQKNPFWITYNQHIKIPYILTPEGKKFTRSDLPPEVYVANGGHASYPESGETGMDNHLGGLTIDNENLQVFMIQKQPWANFEGKWGVGHGSLAFGKPKLSSHPYFQDPGEELKDSGYKLIKVWSPVNIHAVDQYGRHIGINDTGDVEVEIPEAVYSGPDAHPQWIKIFNNSLNVTFYTTGIENGTFDINYQKTESIISEVYNFSNISTTASTIAYLNSTTPGILEIDDDGDGTIDEIISGPIINFSYTPLNASANESIMFNASNSYDPDGFIVSYQWDFGDGTNASNSTVNHSYSESGIYLVTLTIIDNENQSSTATSFLYVNQPPKSNFTYSPLFPSTNDTIQFYDNSYDLDGTIVNWTWDFDDGNTSYLQNLTHHYTIPGNYSVNLTVTDDDGANDSVSKSITVIDGTPPEIIDNTPNEGYTGDLFTFNVSVTDNVGVDSVWVEYWYESGIHTNLSMTNVADDYWEKTAIINDTLDILYYIISANDTINNWNNTGVKNVTVFDNDKPEISYVYDYPDPQEVGGYVNITCDVTDNVDVDEVWVNITYPDNSVHSETMLSGSYYNTSYTMLGSYSYFIWANDTSGNANTSAAYTFTIQDTTSPEIIDHTANNGSTGDSFMFNATIIDLGGVSSAWVEYWYDAGSHIYISMTNVAGDYWEHAIVIDNTLDMLHYIISANDTADNWNNTGIKDVTIHDNDIPEIADVQANPSIQNIGGYVNISAIVIDNIEVDEVYLYLEYPDSSVENFSITQNKTGDTYYCNKTYQQLGIYNYHIWANDTSDNANVSSDYTFEIINQPPYIPSDPSPENGTTDVNIDVDISWDGGDPDPGDTVTYDVYFGDSSPPPQVATGQSDTSYDPGTLEYSTTYYWQIVSWDNHGASTVGPEWDFTTEIEPVSDLDCSGTLSWTGVTPGDTVSGSITVENIGDIDSLLDWEIDSYPNWGDWSFDPDGGDDLLAGETEIIDVEVVAPDEQEETFTGEVVLVNSDDPDDTCIIDVSLATPVNQQVINPLLQMILERFPNAFLILRHLMGL